MFLKSYLEQVHLLVHDGELDVPGPAEALLQLHRQPGDGDKRLLRQAEGGGGRRTGQRLLHGGERIWEKIKLRKTWTRQKKHVMMAISYESIVQLTFVHDDFLLFGSRLLFADCPHFSVAAFPSPPLPRPVSHHHRVWLCYCRNDALGASISFFL